MEWQPIETAPRDGTWILCFDFDDASQGAVDSFGDFEDGDADGHMAKAMDEFEAARAAAAIESYPLFVFTAQFQFGQWIDGLAHTDVSPTHWMPLPAPPNT